MLVGLLLYLQLRSLASVTQQTQGRQVPLFYLKLSVLVSLKTLWSVLTFHGLISSIHKVSDSIFPVTILLNLLADFIW